MSAEAVVFMLIALYGIWFVLTISSALILRVLYDNLKVLREIRDK